MGKKKMTYKQEQKALGMFKNIETYSNRFGRRNISTGDYVKSRHSYESGRFRFDLTNCEARSYDWWVFVLKVGDVVYVNGANFSMQTSKHQDMADNILSAEMPERHGLKVKYVYYREGLQGLEVAIKNMKYEIDQLVTAIQKPRSWKSVNERRRERIDYLFNKIAETEKLAPLFNAQIEANFREREERFDRYQQELEQRRKQRIPKYKRVREMLLNSIQDGQE